MIKNNKAFSLIEVMVVLMLSSVIFLVIYNLISVGLRFFESFSKRSDFSVMQFVKDVEYEISIGNDFFVDGKKLEIKSDLKTVKYIIGVSEKNFSFLRVRKEIISQNSVQRKDFLLKEILEVDLKKEEKDFRKVLLISIVDINGRKVFEGYLP